MNYYIYYKVAADDVRAVRLQVDQLFKEVELLFEIQGRWMHRADDPSTYMEVYEGVENPDGFDAFFKGRATLPGTNRRTERFKLVGTLS